METFDVEMSESQKVMVEYLAEKRGMTTDAYVAFLLSREVWDTSNPATNERPCKAS